VINQLFSRANFRWAFVIGRHFQESALGIKANCYPWVWPTQSCDDIMVNWDAWITSVDSSSLCFQESRVHNWIWIGGNK